MQYRVTATGFFGRERELMSVEVSAPNKKEVRIEFITRDYLFSHGKPPRGRGSWAFAFKANDAVMNAFWSKPDATYAEAKKEAAAEARRRKAPWVWVLP